MSAKRASNSAGPRGWPLRRCRACCCCWSWSDWPRVGGVGGGGTGGASLAAAAEALEAAEELVRCGGGGGGGGGIVGARQGGGGGATLVTGAPLPGREVGGDGGLTPGGLRIRLAGLCCGSFRQSCDWCSEAGVGASTAGERGSRMLCALQWKNNNVSC